MNKDCDINISDFFLTSAEGIYSEAERAISAYSMDKMIENGVLVGLSGGADSVMLLLLLLEYRRRRGLDFKILAVHVNHGIRGDEALRDQHFCERLCDALKVELEVVSISIPELADTYKMGVEEAARFFRYSHFDRIIRGRNDISTIAVAHNMSDNAETVLFNILRGSGIRGAAGIPAVRDNIIRPLIFVKKQDVLLSLSKYNIEFVTDSTNLSSEYTRNYIRSEVIPTLYRVTDDPEKMISRFCINARNDDEYITSLADDFLKHRDSVYNSDLRSLHFSLFVRVLSLMARVEGGAISANIARDIFALLDKDNFSYSLIGKKIFLCERGVCRVTSDVGNKVNYCFAIEEGVNYLSPLNSDFILSYGNIDKSYLNVYKISIQADISSAIIKGGLYLRPKKDGDSIYYGGMTHKIKKMFCDSKIPPSIRGLIPLLCDDEGVVWVPGFGVRDDGGKRGSGRKISVLLGIKTDESDTRLYSGSEFRK